MIAWLPYAGLCLVAGISYQTSMKYIADKVPPYVLMFTAGLTLLIAGAIAYLVRAPGSSMPVMSSKLLWPAVAVGLCTTLIDIGYFFMYRNGAPLAISRTILTVAVALTLTVIGMIMFNEHLTHKQIGGVLMCLLGLVFIMWK